MFMENEIKFDERNFASEENALRYVELLRNSGHDQRFIYDVFRKARLHYDATGHEDILIVVEDMLDRISGFCSGPAKLFDTYLK